VNFILCNLAAFIAVIAAISQERIGKVDCPKLSKAIERTERKETI
jgi:hypothetical protein